MFKARQAQTCRILLACFRPFAVLVPKDSNIIWVCNLLALSVPDVKEDFKYTKGVIKVIPEKLRTHLM